MNGDHSVGGHQPSRRSLPPGTHYAVTTAIGREFKGLTTAMLNRSRAFAEQSGTPVTILTHSAFDYDEVRAVLVERGLLGDGMSLVNQFEDISTWDDDDIRRKLRLPDVDDAVATQVLSNDDPDVTENPYRRRRVVDRMVTQVDHRRADGSVFLSEFRDGREAAFVFHGANGTALGTVGTTRELLHRWIDTLARDPMAWMIVDSRVSARLLLDYRRADVAVMHVLHYSHLKSGVRHQAPRVRDSSAEVLQRMDDLDAIVFLTDAQRLDVEQIYGHGSGNRFNVTNVCELPDVEESVFSRRRDRRRGIMLARFDKGKQVDLAIRAIAAAAESIDPRKRPMLDIYGGGPRRNLLRAMIRTLARRQGTPLRRVLGRALGEPGRRIAARLEPRSSSVRVHLHGHVPDARERFWEASFSLLTSRGEGMALVLVESMARGAIPISFDVKYGPGHIISDGVDGFLVPFTDSETGVRAMTAAIRRTVTMSHDDLAAMRLAAHRRARDFSAASVTRAWIDVMNAVGERKT